MELNHSDIERIRTEAEKRYTRGALKGISTIYNLQQLKYGYVKGAENECLRGMELMAGFAEWANQRYGYVEKDLWEGENDDTYTTKELINLYLTSK